MPPAPARFSITSSWPRSIFGASMRMMRSGGPPGGEGTTTWIGFAGKRCACAAKAARRQTATASRTLRNGNPLRVARGAHDGFEHGDIVHFIAGGKRDRPARGGGVGEMLELGALG